MSKKYLNIDVYNATNKRIKKIFDTFDNIVIAFSGGKDSGVMLEMVYEYCVKNKVKNKVSVYHLDYEGQYSYTTEYVERTMYKHEDVFDYYWLCMPISAECSVSMYQSTWIPWHPEQEEIWLRELPDKSINIKNHEFDFWEFGMSDYQLQMQFSKWIHRKNDANKTAILVGIRSQESLHRYKAIDKDTKNTYEGIQFSTRVYKNIYNVYPVYDWDVKDIWIANGKFGWDYNKLYDLYFQAGLTLHNMRVASPFNDCASDTLRLYKTIEPETWSRLVGRVNGANFAAIYGGTKAMAFKDITLPKNHTWKTYAEFLLKTLPEKTRNIYASKIETSFKYWLETGGALPIETIEEIKDDLNFQNLGKPKDKRKRSIEHEVIKFTDYPDDTSATKFNLVPTWKRICITILKNDTSCKYMGFGQTKDELQKRKEAMNKWENLI